MTTQTIPACHLCQEPCDCNRCKVQRAATDLLAVAERISRYASLPLDDMNGRERERVAIFQDARDAIRKAKGE